MPTTDCEASERQCREYPWLLQMQAPSAWESRCQSCLVTSAHVRTGTANYQMLHFYEELRMEGQEMKEI